MTAPRRPGLETAAFVTLLGFAAALQISIAAAGILLTFTLGLWIALLAAERERPAAPPFSSTSNPRPAPAASIRGSRRFPPLQRSRQPPASSTPRSLPLTSG